MSEDKKKFEDDFSIEPEEEVLDGFGTSSKEAKLKKELKECQKEKNEYLDGWQRSKAELINKKKEFEEEKKKLLKYANEDILSDLTGVLDSFSMAFSNKSTWESVPESWRLGVEHIHSQFTSILNSYGLEEVSPEIGEEFDPNMHDSVEPIDTDNKKEDGLIESVIRKGYSLGGNIIRPAQVRVYRVLSKNS